jgi:hypothetical protein
MEHQRVISFTASGPLAKLLLAYNTGIHAYTSRSVPNGKKERRIREATPGWQEAEKRAQQSLALAVEAAEKASARDPSADDIANAVKQLEQRCI